MLETNDAGGHFETRAFMQEILLSFRVLFAQDPKSRALFTKLERGHARRDNDYDSLLDLLCGNKNGKQIRALPLAFWPEACVDSDAPGGVLVEQNVYNTGTDFPILGKRFSELQAFTERQSPTRMRDLWRDRRNPLQWYTFWAVVWIGGIGILIAFLNLVVAGGQLGVAIKALPP